MFSKRNIIILITVLFLIVVLLSILLLLPQRSSKPTETTPTPTTAIPTIELRTITLAPTPTETQRPNPNLPAIIQYMPVQTDIYTIEYLDKTNTFIVRVLQSPFEQNKRAAQQWFSEHGVKDLGTINILYAKLRLVQ